ncbi:hypothetical protein DFA_07342 [Cavenderia fasciculata]|uniref:EGF-like domain-containing protein n=1 Tax=Cavenderia fasciculata TaxID=261658 RepID=F4PW57_CACFS|nr:uncharacterized protein DFA_07342 [Cavenderia fasciculata]EGG20221.1 hypothetical protein DFA_07342 [Cavenderia fasciculata]|eukprot:XP_004367204.1 hypothetical protein DFA_07342 [Cavenderia fasciculata]
MRIVINSQCKKISNSSILFLIPTSIIPTRLDNNNNIIYVTPYKHYIGISAQYPAGLGVTKITTGYYKDDPSQGNEFTLQATCNPTTGVCTYFNNSISSAASPLGEAWAPKYGYYQYKVGSDAHSYFYDTEPTEIAALPTPTFTVSPYDTIPPELIEVQPYDYVEYDSVDNIYTYSSFDTSGNDCQVKLIVHISDNYYGPYQVGYGDTPNMNMYATIDPSLLEEPMVLGLLYEYTNSNGINTVSNYQMQPETLDIVYYQRKIIYSPSGNITAYKQLHSIDGGTDYNVYVFVESIMGTLKVTRTLPTPPSLRPMIQGTNRVFATPYNTMLNLDPTGTSLNIRLKIVLTATTCNLLVYVLIAGVDGVLLQDRNPTALCIDDSNYLVEFKFYRNIGNVNIYLYDVYGQSDSLETTFDLEQPPTSIIFGDDPVCTQTEAFLLSSPSTNVTQINVQAPFKTLQPQLRQIYLRHFLDGTIIGNTLYSNNDPADFSYGLINYPFGYSSGNTREGIIKYTTYLPKLPRSIAGNSFDFGESQTENTQYLGEVSGLVTDIHNRNPPMLASFSMQFNSGLLADYTFSVEDVEGILYCNISIGAYTQKFTRSQIDTGSTFRNPSFTGSFQVNPAFCGYPVEIACRNTRLETLYTKSGDLYLEGSSGNTLRIKLVDCLRASTSYPIPIHFKYATDPTDKSKYNFEVLIYQEVLSTLTSATLTLTSIDSSEVPQTISLSRDVTSLSTEWMVYKGQLILSSTPQLSSTAVPSLDLEYGSGQSTTYTFEEFTYLTTTQIGDYFDSSNGLVKLYSPTDQHAPQFVSVYHTNGESQGEIIVYVDFDDASDIEYATINVFDRKEPSVEQVLSQSVATFVDGNIKTFMFQFNANLACGAADTFYYVSFARDVYNNYQTWTPSDISSFSNQTLWNGNQITYTSLPPSLLQFDFEPKMINSAKDDESSRSVYFTMTVMTNGQIMSETSSPILYLSELLYIEPVTCTFTLLGQNNTIAEYECSLVVPKNYGLNGVTMSVYGIQNTCGQFVGYSNIDLASGGYPNFLSIKDVDPVNLELSQMRYTDRVITVLGDDLSLATATDFLVYGQSENTVIPSVLAQLGLTMTTNSQSRQSYNFTFHPINQTTVLLNLTDDSPLLNPDAPVYVEYLGDAYLLQVNVCPNNCNGLNGDCQLDGQCQCTSSWIGEDCSVGNNVSCPVDLSNSEICSGIGLCSLSKTCMCPVGYNGPACEYPNPDPYDMTILIDQTRPKVTYTNLDKIDQQAKYGQSNFTVAFESIRELDLDDVMVKETFFKDMQFQDNTTTGANPVYTYTGSLAGSIVIELTQFTNYTILDWRGENTTMQSNTIKYSINLSNYPFASRLNRIQLTWRSSAVIDRLDGCEYTFPTQSIVGGSMQDMRYFSMPLHATSLYGRFPNTIYLDNRATFASNRVLEQVNGTTQLDAGYLVAIELPYHQTASIDPDFSVLLGKHSNPEQYLNCQSDSSENNSITWKIAVGVVVGVVGLAAIIAGAIYYSKHSTKGKIFVHKMKSISKRKLSFRSTNFNEPK